MPKPFPIHKPNTHTPAPRKEPQHGDQLDLIEEEEVVEETETETETEED